MSSMTDNFMKWLYTFFLLSLTIFWAMFTVWIVSKAMDLPNPGKVLEASGASVLLGMLITLNVNTNQYWFRKKSPDDPPA